MAKKESKEERAKRLAQQLRANLRRRKTQTREIARDGDTGDSDTGDTGADTDKDDTGG